MKYFDLKRELLGYESYYRDFEDELWQIFITLPSDKLAVYFELFQKYFGESSCKYAQNTYEKWKNRSVIPSIKTTERLIYVLPLILTPAQRISLFTKLFDRESNDDYNFCYSRSYKTLQMSWDDYENSFQSIRNEIIKDKAEFNNKQHFKISKELMARITWLCCDEIKVAEEFIEEKIKARALVDFDNALSSFDSYYDKCNWMYRNNMVYDPLAIEIKTPTSFYTIKIVAKQKTFLQKVNDFFKIR